MRRVPIARSQGKAGSDKVLARIGAGHNKTAAQISLRFLVQQDIVIIARTSKKTRLAGASLVSRTRFCNVQPRVGRWRYMPACLGE